MASHATAYRLNTLGLISGISRRSPGIEPAVGEGGNGEGNEEGAATVRDITGGSIGEW